MNDDSKWMEYAISLAKKAGEEGEVPVGAVIIANNEIVAEGWNHPIASSDPTAHAEIIALRNACNNKKNYRLPGMTLYVTLEPCAMCAGAIIHSRIARVVFGASDPKAGAAGSCINIFSQSQLNHHAEINGGVLESECARVLVDFFKDRR